MNSSFRKKSINNYSDSERLDRAVKIASPLSWLGIIAAALMIVSVIIWSFFGSIPEIKTVKAVVSDKSNALAVHSFVSGRLTGYTVGEGDKVKSGQIVAEVESSGKIVAVTSPFDGTVGTFLFSENDIIYAYDEILRLTPKVDGDTVAVSYVPVSQSGRIASGMEVKLYLNSESSCLEAEVIAVGDCAASEKNMRYVIGRDNSIRKSLSDERAVAAVVYKIKNKQINDDFLIDNRRIPVKNGSIINAEIIIENRAPVSFLFGFLTSGEAEGE